MIYLNPCLFFSLLALVFFLNISCAHFSDTSCLFPWNLSEFLTVWYILLWAAYSLWIQGFTSSKLTELLLRFFLRPHWAPNCSSDREILPFFIPFHKFPSQGDQWCSTSISSIIVLSNYSTDLTDTDLKEWEKQELPFNYQGQNEDQHFSWGWKGLFHVPPQISHPTLKFPLNSQELRAEKGRPCFGST